MISTKFQTALKALLLIGMSLFLYSRIANGSLFFYINQRFAGLVLFAVIGLLVVAVSYYYDEDQTAKDKSPLHNHKDAVHHDHTHSSHDHDHHDHHDHDHGLAWGGVTLLIVPIVLGLLVRPQPLGASALANREVNIGSSNSTMPAAVRAAQEKDNLSKNILDWLYDFQTAGDPQAFVGQEAKIVGFVFRDERLADDEFTAARFTVSCCVADASYVGLVVRWPEALSLEQDQWIEARGHFDVGTFDGRTMPILIADEVKSTAMPQQPYLYPIAYMAILQSRFDRLVFGVIVFLILLISIMISVGVSSEAQNTLSTQIVYTALDSEFREQLFIADLNLESFSVSEPQQVTDEAIGVWGFAVSPDSRRIVYTTLNPNSNSDLWLLTRGESEPEYLLACPQSACSNPAWSADGQFLAFTRRSSSSIATTGGLGPPRLWLLNIESGETAQVFGDNQSIGFDPLWSASDTWLSYFVPDLNGVSLYNLENGKNLFYETQTGHRAAWHPSRDSLLLSAMQQAEEQFLGYLYLTEPASGVTNLSEMINLSGANAAVDDSSPTWSADGAWIAFRRKELEGERASLGKQIWIMRADGSDARPLTSDLEFDHGQPVWSPDGRFLLYHRFPLKGPDITLSIWIVNVETGTATELISPGQRPQWLAGTQK